MNGITYHKKQGLIKHKKLQQKSLNPQASIPFYKFWFLENIHKYMPLT